LSSKIYIPFMQFCTIRLQLLTINMRISLLLILILSLTSCTSSDGDLNFFSLEDDLMMGEQLHSILENDPSVKILNETDNASLYLMLNQIKEDILNSGHLYHAADLPWKLNIVHNDSIVNAFAAPGGYLYIYTGLLHEVESIDELAGIIAHEIAHADRRHGSEQLSKQYGIKLLIGFFIGDAASIIADVGSGLIGLNFSRKNEKEADEMAVSYLLETTYNPIAFADFFERITDEDHLPAYLTFLSTHPDPGNRKENIEKLVRTLPGKKPQSHESSFQKMKLLLQDI